ncbi:MAG: YdiU family protein [Sphingomonadaceae bacterium]|nr:YdiU family protein [Sphingomonadaceae bacterium]
MTVTDPIPFDNSYARLPERFFARVNPAVREKPVLIRVNEVLAHELGLAPDWLSSDAGLDVLSGRSVADGSEPIAMAYAGHQFGNFVPQLGDGRAILLGEMVDCQGQRRDLQLKGAGETPFSRNGDGQAALGSVLREYVVSEAMAALGVPTTRALAAVATGDPVYREKALPGAVLTRVASSHIRVGTFQFFAAREDTEAVRHLADHVIARHYPSAEGAQNPYLALLEEVIAAQAKLISRWMLVGFIHGVMNTDNMSIAGETIDYGPCAFLDTYDPETVFSSIDQFGRYAYGNQPSIALWNLARLAETLLPLLSENEEAAIAIAENALEDFEPLFQAAYLSGMTRKLGIAKPQDEDAQLASAILAAMAENAVDFTLFFRRLADAIEPGPGEEALRSLFADPSACDLLLQRWRKRLTQEPENAGDRRKRMRAVNPVYIPRNHRVEAMIEAAVEDGDFAPFEELLTVLAKPFEDRLEFNHYENPPQEHERVTATFCGT